MSLRDITKPAVITAFDEFDRLQPDGMLKKYGGGLSRCWFIDYHGKRYDQKLTLRAAHELSGLGPLPPGSGTFTAGDAKRHLESLGLEVIRYDNRESAD